MGKIRVLIADDHVFYREGVCSMLGTVEGVEVAGEAATGEDTVVMAIKDKPDVILMDIKMPDLSGIEATRRILNKCPTIGILILTMYEDDDSVFAAMRAGARGYLLKDADRDELVRAVAAVNRGEAIFSPAIAQRLINYFTALPSRSSVLAFPELTDREREILGFIAQGYNNMEIADKLVLSLKTVQNHVSSIYTKLQVADRAQAILRAQKAGLGSDS